MFLFMSQLVEKKNVMKRRLHEFYKSSRDDKSRTNRMNHSWVLEVEKSGVGLVGSLLRLVIDFCRDEQFGVMLHWGVYSVPGFDDVGSAQRRKIQNGSEWYMKRLLERGDINPYATSGWQETQRYHQRQYGNKKYHEFAQEFTAEHWDPDEWMRLFSLAGASYVVITSKHHDGFCLWPSKTTTFTITHTPAVNKSSDIMAQMKKSATRYGLRFGIYYSWGEFVMGPNYVDTIMRPQIQELIQYEPDMFWFDGDWMVCKTGAGQSAVDDSLVLIRQCLPFVEINDRIGHRLERKDPHWMNKGVISFRVYDDRAIPQVKPAVRWQHCNTIGLSWGYNRSQMQHHYKTKEQIDQLRKKVKQLGGDFLINLGPTPSGRLHPLEIAAIS
jgi:alpha-L-fucosidase